MTRLEISIQLESSSTKQVPFYHANRNAWKDTAIPKLGAIAPRIPRMPRDTNVLTNAGGEDTYPRILSSGGNSAPQSKRPIEVWRPKRSWRRPLQIQRNLVLCEFHYVNYPARAAWGWDCVLDRTPSFTQTLLPEFNTCRSLSTSLHRIDEGTSWSFFHTSTTPTWEMASEIKPSVCLLAYSWFA